MSKISFQKPGGPAPLVAAPPVAPPAPVQAAPAPAVTAVPAVNPLAPVATEVVQTPTPVAGVTVESVNTAAPAGPLVKIENNAPAADTGTAVYQPKQPAFFDDESFDPSDMVLPRLNIVQKVGDLSTVFPGGTIVLNGQLVLADAPAPNSTSAFLRIMVCGFQPTVFVEKVEGGLSGNRFNSEAEVVAAGGTLDYNEAQQTGKTWYVRSATALVLIEKPEKCDESAFPIEIAGKKYALSLFTMKASGYTHAAKHIKSWKKMGHLKQNGYRGGFIFLASKLEKSKTGNYYYIPVVKAAEATTPEFRAEVQAFLGF